MNQIDFIKSRLLEDEYSLIVISPNKETAVQFIKTIFQDGCSISWDGLYLRNKDKRSWVKYYIADSPSYTLTDFIFGYMIEGIVYLNTNEFCYNGYDWLSELPYTICRMHGESGSVHMINL